MRHLLIAAAMLLPISAAATHPAPPESPAPTPEPPARERSEPGGAPADRNQCGRTYGSPCMANGPAKGVTVQSTTPKRADRHMIRAEDYDLVLKGHRCQINADLVWWCRPTD